MPRITVTTVTTDQHGRAAATYEVGRCVLGDAVPRHGFAIAYLRYLTGRFEEPEAWRHRP